MTAKRTHPPVPILEVLAAAMDALHNDGRFRRIENGHVEVAWRQATKGRNGEGDRPERYALTIECGFVPRDARASRRGMPSALPESPKSSGGAVSREGET